MNSHVVEPCSGLVCRHQSKQGERARPLESYCRMHTILSFSRTEEGCLDDFTWMSAFASYKTILEQRQGHVSGNSEDVCDYGAEQWNAKKEGHRRDFVRSNGSVKAW